MTVVDFGGKIVVGFVTGFGIVFFYNLIMGYDLSSFYSLTSSSAAIILGMFIGLIWEKSLKKREE